MKTYKNLEDMRDRVSPTLDEYAAEALDDVDSGVLTPENYEVVAGFLESLSGEVNGDTKVLVDVYRAKALIGANKDEQARPLLNYLRSVTVTESIHSDLDYLLAHANFKLQDDDRYDEALGEYDASEKAELMLSGLVDRINRINPKDVTPIYKEARKLVNQHNLNDEELEDSYLNKRITYLRGVVKQEVNYDESFRDNISELKESIGKLDEVPEEIISTIFGAYLRAVKSGHFEYLSNAKEIAENRQGRLRNLKAAVNSSGELVASGEISTQEWLDEIINVYKETPKGLDRKLREISENLTKKEFNSLSKHSQRRLENAMPSEFSSVKEQEVHSEYKLDENLIETNWVEPKLVVSYDSSDSESKLAETERLKKSISAEYKKIHELTDRLNKEVSGLRADIDAAKSSRSKRKFSLLSRFKRKK